MFDPVACDEIGFAMSLFINSTQRRFGPPFGDNMSETPSDREEGEHFFIALTTGPLETPEGTQQSLLLGTALFRCFLALWDQYAGDQRRESICARVLGFCGLMERTRGAIVDSWIVQSPGGPEFIVLHPAVVEAVANTALNHQGLMSERTLVADIERIARETGSEVRSRTSDQSDTSETPPSDSTWPRGVSETAGLLREMAQVDTFGPGAPLAPRSTNRD